METLGNHLIQMACWLTGFWFIYFVFLRKETFYETNRWFLLFGLLCSLIMPFFPVTYTATRAPLNTDLLLKATMVTTVTQPEPSFFRENLWLWIYLAGILLFTIRFISQWMKVRKIEKKGIRLQVESAEVFLIEKETAPFSFFRKIFISQSLQSELEIKTIVSHEKVHIEERHWIDLLIFEVVRALQWFNPLLLFYRKAMMQNHEYLADRGATANGMNIRTYQAILANQLLGIPVVKYASSFTMFNPTKRVLMMNKNRTRPMKQFKLLWALPLAALILYAFAEPKYINADTPSSVSIQTEKGQSASGVITDNKGEALPGAHIIVANSTTGTISDINGKFSLSGLKKDDELFISFVGYKTVKMKAGENVKVQMERNVIKVAVAEAGENIAPPPPPPPPADLKIGSAGTPPLIVVDGKIITIDINNIDPNTIEKIEVLKNESATEIYGEKGGNGVILITTKKNQSGNTYNIKVDKDQIVDKNGAPVSGFANEKKVVPEKVEVIGYANQQKKDDNQFVAVEEIPQFPGGTSELGAYLTDKTSKTGKEGKVEVYFIVNTDGSIGNIKIVESASSELDQLATKIIEEMPKWTPGKQHGKAVKVEMQIGILFGKNCYSTKHRFKE